MIRIAKLFAAPLLGSIGSYAVPAMAAEHPVVVELYTSQGCSSCPPVDAYFKKELADREDVIALALHVDYWDYIGWKDDFADPAYTKRQRNYARAAGKRSIYTPQMVIGGLDHVVGNVPHEVRTHLKTHAKLDAGVDLQLSRNGDRLTISLQAQETLDVPMVVQVVRYAREETRNIKRGENAGRTLTYANIVTSWDTIGEWNTRRAKTMKTKVIGDSAVVVLVQRKGHGRIEAAARLR